MVKMLPIVQYEGVKWFFDERLRQIRNIRNPHDFMNLNDFEVDYFRNKRKLRIGGKVAKRVKFKTRSGKTVSFTART